MGLFLLGTEYSDLATSGAKCAIAKRVPGKVLAFS